MAKTAVVTVRLDERTNRTLKALALKTRRSRSFLAAEAIAEYVRAEREFIAAVEEGLKQVKAGKLVDHKRVVDEFERRVARHR